MLQLAARRFAKSTADRLRSQPTAHRFLSSFGGDPAEEEELMWSPQQWASPPGGVEASLRFDLAVAHRLTAHHGMDELIWNHISARHADSYLVTPGDKHFAMIAPGDLVRGDDGENVTAGVIHGGIYDARPDVGAIAHLHTDAVVFVSNLPGDAPLEYFTQNGGAFFGNVEYHDLEGVSTDHDEQQRIAADLGSSAHTLIMRNHGAVTVGKTVAEAWVRMFYLDRICTAQMNLMFAGVKARPVSGHILAKMSATYDDPAFRGGMEWPGMVEFARRHLGCDEFS